VLFSFALFRAKNGIKSLFIRRDSGTFAEQGILNKEVVQSTGLRSEEVKGLSSVLGLMYTKFGIAAQKVSADAGGREEYEIVSLSSGKTEKKRIKICKPGQKVTTAVRMRLIEKIPKHSFVSYPVEGFPVYGKSNKSYNSQALNWAELETPYSYTDEFDQNKGQGSSAYAMSLSHITGIGSAREYLQGPNFASNAITKFSLRIPNETKEAIMPGAMEEASLPITFEVRYVGTTSNICGLEGKSGSSFYIQEPVSPSYEKNCKGCHSAGNQSFTHFATKSTIRPPNECASSRLEDAAEKCKSRFNYVQEAISSSESELLVKSGFVAGWFKDEAKKKSTFFHFVSQEADTAQCLPDFSDCPLVPLECVCEEGGFLQSCKITQHLTVTDKGTPFAGDYESNLHYVTNVAADYVTMTPNSLYDKAGMFDIAYATGKMSEGSVANAKLNGLFKLNDKELSKLAEENASCKYSHYNPVIQSSVKAKFDGYMPNFNGTCSGRKVSLTVDIPVLYMNYSFAYLFNTTFRIPGQADVKCSQTRSNIRDMLSSYNLRQVDLILLVDEKGNPEIREKRPSDILAKPPTSVVDTL